MPLTYIDSKGKAPLKSVIGVSEDTYLPLTGEVDGDGWMLGDGSVVPSGHTLTGWTVPDLSDDRFLMGGTTASAVGGENTTILSIANLPAHNHGISDPGHSHSVSLSSGPRYVQEDQAHDRIGADPGGSAGLSSVSVSGGTSGAGTGISSGSIGSGSSFENRPKFYTVVWLVQVG